MKTIHNLLRKLTAAPEQDFLRFMMLLALLPGLNDYSLFLIDFGYPPSGSVWYIIVVCVALLGIPLAYLICRRKNNWTAFYALTPLILLWITWIFPFELFLKLFQLSGQLAFAWLLYRGGVRQGVFGLFLLVIWVSLSFFHLALFLGVTLVLRTLVVLVQQNWKTVSRIGWKNFTISALRAFLLWSPMLLAVIPAYYLTEKVEEKAADGIYAYTFLDSYTVPRVFEQDLNKSLDSLMIRMKIQAHRRVDSIRQASADVAGSTPGVVGDLIRNSIVPPRAKKIDLDCGWWRLDCHAAQGAARAAAGAASKAFQETGRKLANNAENKLEVFFNKGDQSVEEKLNALDAEIDRSITNTRTDTERTVLSAHRLLQLVLFLSEIAFFFIVLKSYTYVLARVLFSKSGGDTYATLGDATKTMPHGRVTSKGSNYQVAADAGVDYYVSRRFEPAGRAPRISLPQWHVGILSRLFNGCYTMNRLVMETGRPAVDFNAAVGIEFVEWEIAEGETVIFSFSEFVAMSGSVKLSRIVSLRLESMLLGKMFFTAATGPGVIILRSKGNVIMEVQDGQPTAKLNCVPQHRILAWQEQTRFNVESELNVFDVFFSGVYLEPLPNNPTVINSDQTGKARSGIGRFFWHFLLPN